MDVLAPKLKEGISIREFDTSGEENTYVLNYGKKYWQISEYTYSIIELIDGKRDLAEIADLMTQEAGIEIKEENIQYVLDSFLSKRGLLEGTEDSVKTKPVGISKFLWFKVPFLKSRIIQKFRFLSVMFNKKVMWFFLALCILTFITIVIEVFTGRITLRANYLTVAVLLCFSTMFHEFGHSSACMRYGLKPGDIGFALYFTLPVLYSDVSSTWSLKRKERVLVDVGGLYFQAIYLSLLYILGVFLNENVMKISAGLGFFAMYKDLNPLIKMDGYWVASDLMGVPNLHQLSGEGIKKLVLKLFGIQYSSRNLNDIGKREKYFFFAYSVIFNVFMLIITIMLLRFSVYLPQILYGGYVNFAKTDFSNLPAVFYATVNLAVLLIPCILMLRILYYSSKGVFYLIYDLVKAFRSHRSQESELQEE